MYIIYGIRIYMYSIYVSPQLSFRRRYSLVWCAQKIPGVESHYFSINLSRESNISLYR